MAAPCLPADVRRSDAGLSSSAVALPAAASSAARLRASFEALRARELAWLRALPPARQAQLAPLDDDDSSDSGGNDLHRSTSASSSFQAHHVLHCGEVALAMLGLKPCVLFAHALWPGGGADGAPSFGAAFVADVVRPWLLEFNLLAKAENCADGGPVFTLHEVPSACAPFPAHPGFARAALLVAERHSCATAAKRVFLRGAPRVADSVLAAALGYPGDTDAPRAACVAYLDTDHAPYRQNEDDDEELCCVPLFEFRAAPPDAQRVGAHFREAATAARAALGVHLALDLSECCCDEADDGSDDDAQRHCWPDAAVARCWGAAFGSSDAALAAMKRGEVRVSGAWTARRVMRVLARVPPATSGGDGVGGAARRGGAGA
jgi:hypothetical protein